MQRANNLNVSVEVEADRSLVVVLDRSADTILIPWQDAYALADTLGLAIADARDEGDLIDPAALAREQAQVKLCAHRGMVAVVFGWADRLRFSWRSAAMVRDALRIKAQEVQYAEREILLPAVRLPGLRSMVGTPAS